MFIPNKHSFLFQKIFFLAIIFGLNVTQLHNYIKVKIQKFLINISMSSIGQLSLHYYLMALLKQHKIDLKIFGKRC